MVTYFGQEQIGGRQNSIPATGFCPNCKAGLRHFSNVSTLRNPIRTVFHVFNVNVYMFYMLLVFKLYFISCSLIFCFFFRSKSGCYWTVSSGKSL